jgi:hypothetical protein
VSSAVIVALTAFFFSGLFIVTVTTPSCRSTTRVSIFGTIISGVGFNPFRQQQRRSTDYVLVAAAAVIVIALLVWALFA